jgi:hypothetical protein
MAKKIILVVEDNPDDKLLTTCTQKKIFFANKFNFKRGDKIWLKQVIKKISL